MAGNLTNDMNETIRQTNAANTRYGGLIAQYQAACISHDWDEADRLRPEVVASVEGFLDGLAMMYRRMAWAEETGG